MSSRRSYRGSLARRFRSAAEHHLLILQVPTAWLRSLLAAAILLDGRWSRYMGFRPKNALNSFFYRTQWLNIDRYGRDGISPVAGLGDYPLSRWSHITALSHSLYAYAGATTTLLGTLAWALSHLVWIESARAGWVLLVTLTLTLSSTAYAMAMVRQNYNVIGWLWMPLGLFAVYSEMWIIAAIAWFAASMTSITVIFVAAPLMVVHALVSGQFESVWVLMPAFAKISLHIVSMLREGSLNGSLLALGKLIGLIPTAAKYRRSSMRFGRFNIYFSALYSAGCLLSWLVAGTIPWLPLTALLIFVINQRLFRFADVQSVIMLFVSVFVAHTLTMSPGPSQWIIVFLIANPIPYFFGLLDNDNGSRGKHVIVFTPFDHTSIEKDCESLLEPVPVGARVIFAFDDPAGVYESIFDGYRNAIEPLFYVAARRGVHLFPDWHAVAESNRAGEFHIWGRSVNKVLDNLGHWHADHVVYYLPSGEDIGPEWTQRFDVLTKFDWAPHLDGLGNARPWSGDLPCPQFALLRVKALSVGRDA